MKAHKTCCSVCGEYCFHKNYPEVVFSTIDENNVVVCENCSVEYEMRNGQIRYRQDLVEKGYKPYEPWIEE